jgi:hypothetical protein
MATISQRISLEGSEDILKKLEEIGKIGAAAFEQIKSAAEKMRVDAQLDKTAEAADGLVTAGSELVKQFDALAEAASQTDKELKQVGDVADKVGEGLGKIAADGAKAAEAITAVGDASKQASTEVVKSGDAAEKSSTSYVELGLSAVRTGAAVVTAGAGVSQAGTAVASLGVQTIGATAAVGTLAISLGSVLVGAIGAAVGAIGLLGEALASIASSDAKLSAALDRTAQKTQQIGQGFSELQVGQAAFEQIGISAEKFRTVMGNIASDLASFNPFKAITESIDKIPDAARAALEAEKKLLEKQLELSQKDISLPRGRPDLIKTIEEKLKALNIEEKLSDVEKKRIDTQEELTRVTVNNLTTIFNLMKQIEGGQKAIEFDPLVSAATKIDAVKLRLNEVAKTGGDVSQSLLNIIANLNSLDAAAVGKAFGLSDTDVDRIQRYGSEVTKVNGLLDKIRGAGVLISPDAAATFDRMKDSVQRLDSAWARLKQAWASTVFSELGASGATAFGNLTASVVEFVAKGVEGFNKLTVAVGAFFDKIRESSVTKSISDTINKSLEGLNSILANIFGNIAKGAGASDEAVQKIKDTIMHFGEEVKVAGDLTKELTQKSDAATKGFQAFGTAAEIAKKNAEHLADQGGKLSEIKPPEPPKADLYQQYQKAVAETEAAIKRADDALWKFTNTDQKISAEGAKEFKASFADIVALVPGLTQLGKPFKELPEVRQQMDRIKNSILQMRDEARGLNLFSPVSLSAEEAARAVKNAFNIDLNQNINSVEWSDIGKGATGAAEGAAQAFQSANTSIQTSVAETKTAVDTATTTPTPSAWQWIADTATSVWEQTKTLAQQAYDAVVQFVTTAPGGAWQWVVDSATSVWEQTKTLAQQAYQSIVSFVTTPVANAWQWLQDSFQAVLDWIAEKWAKFKSSLGLGGAPGGAAGGEVGGSAGFAGGGLLGGRGSGTSDSNLAWVSRGEYITPARAVAQPGVLAFLEALRRSGGNLRDVLDGMGRFALGGMVRTPIAIPAFAGGGGMSNVTINFPGLPEITGLRASSAVVDELRKAAAMAQVRSGGRKPSRYS